MAFCVTVCYGFHKINTSRAETRLTLSMPQLLMTRFFTSPSHNQQWYRPYRIQDYIASWIIFLVHQQKTIKAKSYAIAAWRSLFHPHPNKEEQRSCTRRYGKPPRIYVARIIHAIHQVSNPIKIQRYQNDCRDVDLRHLRVMGSLLHASIYLYP